MLVSLTPGINGAANPIFFQQEPKTRKAIPHLLSSYESNAVVDRTFEVNAELFAEMCSESYSFTKRPSSLPLFTDSVRLLTSGEPIPSLTLNYIAEQFQHAISDLPNLHHFSSVQRMAGIFSLRFQQVIDPKNQKWKFIGEGFNGARFLSATESVSPFFVVKTAERGVQYEEPFHGITRETGIKRESLASSLAGRIGLEHVVPLTVRIKTDQGIQSLQLVIRHNGSMSEYATRNQQLPRLHVATTHKSALFDSLFSNTDRHQGNFLINNNLGILIDNEGILSDNPERDRPKIETVYLREMYKPVSSKTKAALKAFDPQECAGFLRNKGISENAITTLINKTDFFKYALLDCPTIAKTSQLTAREMALLSIHFHKEFLDGQDLKEIIRSILVIKDEIGLTSPEKLGSRTRFLRLKERKFNQEVLTESHKSFIFQEILGMHFDFVTNPLKFAQENFNKKQMLIK
jgi:hypothetical protein